jgi:hypothetical protein
MITLKDFMETIDYKITEGSEYCWQCFGPNAYRLDSWNQDHNGHTVSILFDTRTHVVYETNAYDYKHNRAYRLINPIYKSAHENEAAERGVNADEAWDEVNYVDLETAEDFLEKARAIVSGEDYDTRVAVPLTLDKDQMYELMTMAHERDVTLNQMVEALLRDAIDNVELLNDWVGQDIHKESDVSVITDTSYPPFPIPKKKKKKDKK